MLSIGWVIFWKTVIVGVWAIALERWQTFKRRRVANGIELTLNPKTGRYQPNNWPETFEIWARRIFFSALAIWLVFCAFVTYIVVAA